MTSTTAFLLGFLLAGSLCSALALAYYLRALRRVKSIKSAITRYQSAQKLVSQACDDLCPKA